MASLVRSRASTDAQNAALLYTILKQLDTKFVDWASVAAELGITNGHAARMRYTRLKQNMEGTKTKSKGQRSKMASGKGGKKGQKRAKGWEFKVDGDGDEDEVVENETKIEAEDFKRDESTIEEKGINREHGENSIVIKPDPAAFAPTLHANTATTTSTRTLSPTTKPDPNSPQSPPTKKIKLEPTEESDIFIVDQPTSNRPISN